MELPIWWSHAVLFPGVVFHELSHYAACLAVGANVSRVKWWGRGEASVVHEIPHDPGAMIIISMAPFMLSTLFGTVFLVLGHVLVETNASYVQGALSYWVGISLVYHGFPSSADQGNMWKSLNTFYERVAMHGNLIQRLSGFLFLVLSMPLFAALFILTRMFGSKSMTLNAIWPILLFFITYLLLFPMGTP